MTLTLIMDYNVFLNIPGHIIVEVLVRSASHMLVHADATSSIKSIEK